MKIALDGMGGDFAPGPNVDGAIAALAADPEIHVCLVGETSALQALLDQREYTNDRLTIHQADEVVGMEEKPTEALLKKPNNSISVCWRMMANREVDAVVSAGNTGAVVGAGLRTRLFLKGVKRPGIATALPTAQGKTVLMDVGANPAARPEHLVQYAYMGSIYAQQALGVEHPRIGLLNIGSEEGKGNDLYRESHKILAAATGLNGTYVGNVEGRGLYHGEVDVLVCEGFVGNVVLKVSEGMAEFMLQAIGGEVVKSLQSEQQAAANAFREIGRRYQYSEEGGAPLLGIDGVCIICHGSSNEVSIRNALRMARKMHDQEINSRIVEKLQQRKANAM